MPLVITTGLHSDWCDFASKRISEMGVLGPSDPISSNIGMAEFTEKVCRSYKVSTIRSTKFRQVSPGKAWHISASSVIVDNADVNNWSWANPDNIFLLEFWQDFDPLCKFILVYDSLQSFLARMISDKSLTEKQKQALTSKWVNYHREMLRFYHSNMDKCVLTHIEAFDESATSFAKLMSSKLDVDARLLNSQANLDRNAIAEVSAQQILTNLEDLSPIKTYAELENSADLQRSGPYNTLAMASAAITQHENIRKDHRSAIQKIETLETELSVVKTNLSSVERKFKVESDRFSAQTNQYATDISGLNKQLENHKNDSDREEGLLMKQLLQIQEELEFYYKKSLTTEVEAPVQTNLVNGPASSGIAALHESEAKALNPERIVIDFKNFVYGNGWHNAEDMGRWAGPTNESVVFLNKISPANYVLEVRIIDAMALDILDGLKISFNGHSLKTKTLKLSNLSGALAPLRRAKAKMRNVEKPYPVRVTALIPTNHFDGNKKFQELKFHAPSVLCPSDTGGTETRDLSVCYEFLTLTPR